MYTIGKKVAHALYGIGTVEAKEEKYILGKTIEFFAISFQNDRLKIMVNSSQRSEFIRELMTCEEVPRVLNFLRTFKSGTQVKSSERFNLNLNKIKSTDPYKLTEVIKALTDLSKTKKLTPKELNMLKQSKGMLCGEICMVTNTPLEEVEALVEKAAKEQEEADNQPQANETVAS
jgi:CarD family transcriptional regulator